MYGRLGQEILAIQEQEMEPTESQENLQEETETKAATTKDIEIISIIRLLPLLIFAVFFSTMICFSTKCCISKYPVMDGAS